MLKRMMDDIRAVEDKKAWDIILALAESVPDTTQTAGITKEELVESFKLLPKLGESPTKHIFIAAEDFWCTNCKERFRGIPLKIHACPRCRAKGTFTLKDPT